MQKAFPLLKSLIMPMGIVFLSLLVYVKGLLIGISPPVVTFSVYLLLIISLGLSIGFKKSRFFFVLLILSFNHLLQTNYPGTYTLQPFLLVVIPFNLLVFALIGERGITSFWGKFSLGWILLQVIIVCSYIDDHHIDLSNSHAQLQPIFANPLWQWLLIGLFISVLGVLSIFKFNRSYGAFIGIILAVSSGLCFSDDPLAWPLFSSGAALIIILETIQDMYRLAFMDELTGLYSRRSFNMDLMLLSGTYTISMVDIDHFKRINDTYGHDVGDQALRYITSFMWRTPRGVKAYRYGGEEFALVFSGVSKDEAVPYLEELRKTMCTRPFTLRSKDRPARKPQKSTSNPKSDNKVTVTVSIGVADNGRKSFKPNDVLKAADKALYQAKKNGRNRTCVYH